MSFLVLVIWILVIRICFGFGASDFEFYQGRTKNAGRELRGEQKR